MSLHQATGIVFKTYQGRPFVFSTRRSAFIRRAWKSRRGDTRSYIYQFTVSEDIANQFIRLWVLPLSSAFSPPSNVIVFKRKLYFQIMEHFIAEHGHINSGPDVLNPIFPLFFSYSKVFSSSQGHWHNGVWYALNCIGQFNPPDVNFFKKTELNIKTNTYIHLCMHQD